MDTFANANEINQYIDYLTDQVFSILPVFEETGYSESLQKKNLQYECKIRWFLSSLSFYKSICYRHSFFDGGVRGCQRTQTDSLLCFKNLLSSITIKGGG